MDQLSIDLLFKAASEKGKSSLIKKCDPSASNIRDKKGQTLLHVAAGYGKKNLVTYLIDQGADVNAQDHGGLCPLHNSCCHLHLMTTEILLNRGANVNLVDEKGWTALHFVLSRKVQPEVTNTHYWPLILLLLKFGADPHITTLSGRSCINIITNSEDKLTVKLEHLLGRLRQCEPEEREAIIDKYLTVEDYFEIVKIGDTKLNELQIISTPRLVNSRYQLRENITPLHRAAGYCHLKVAELLVQRGADINAKDSYNRVPLHNAAQYGHVDMITFLVLKGSNINTQDLDGRTPLHAAAVLFTYEACLTLVNLGADMNIKDVRGAIPYDLASSVDIREVIKPKEQLVTKTVGDATYVSLPPVIREPAVYSSEPDELMMDSDSDKPLFTSTDKHQIKKIILQETDKKYKLIENRMLSSIVQHDSDSRFKHTSYDIISIELILNQKVWTNYYLMCQILKNEYSFKNEKLLFHGSNFTEDILKNGFDERYAQRDGMFGTGIYFAKHSSKSNQYTFGFGKGCPKHNDETCYICERQIIYAQVALGRSLISKQAIPKCIHGPPGFSSITGEPNHTAGLLYHEYVIYKGAQAYPLYVVRYRLKK